MMTDARNVSPRVSQPWNAAIVSSGYPRDPRSDRRDELAEGHDDRERHGERHAENR